jgi:hypothetical protein
LIVGDIKDTLDTILLNVGKYQIECFYAYSSESLISITAIYLDGIGEIYFHYQMNPSRGMNSTTEECWKITSFNSSEKDSLFFDSLLQKINKKFGNPIVSTLKKNTSEKISVHQNNSITEIYLEEKSVHLFSVL